MTKKIFSQNNLRKTLLGIFLVIPFLFAGQAHATTPFTIWNDYTVPMTSCGEITVSGSGPYTIDPSFDNDSLDGSGNCFVISGDGVTIDGGGHTINGNITSANGQDGAGSPGASYTLQNVVMLGTLTSGNGGINNPFSGGPGGNGGSITITNSTTTSIVTGNGGTGGNAYGGGTGGNGGAVTVTNSTMTSVTTGNGGTGGDGYYSGAGGNGGSINITNSASTLFMVGTGGVFGGAGSGQPGYAGLPGSINIYTSNTISSCRTIYSSGTYTLAGDIGSGGECLIINANGVTVNGGGHTINGNVDGSSKTIGGAGYDFELHDTIVTGTISSNGKSADNNNSIASFSQTDLEGIPLAALKGSVSVDGVLIGVPGIPITACQTLSAVETYELMNDMGDGSSECLTVATSGVAINGNGHMVKGTIGGDGMSYSLKNIAVSGSVNAGVSGHIDIASSTVGDVNTCGITITSVSNTGFLGIPGSCPTSPWGGNSAILMVDGYLGNSGSSDYATHLMNGGNGGNVITSGNEITISGSVISAVGAAGRNGSLAGTNGTLSIGKISSPFSILHSFGTTISALSHLYVYGPGALNLGDMGPNVGGPFPTLPGSTITDSSECNLTIAGTYYLGNDIDTCNINSDGVTIDAQRHTIGTSISSELPDNGANSNGIDMTNNTLLYHLNNLGLTDSSGNGHTGTITALGSSPAPTIVPGFIDNAIHFSLAGVNSNNLGNYKAAINTGVILGSTHTISMWVNMDTNFTPPDGWTAWIFATHHAFGNNGSVSARAVNTDGKFCVNTNFLDGFTLIIGCSTSGFGGWHHVAWVSSGGNHKLYIDGNLKTDYNGGTITNTDPLVINSIDSINPSGGISGSYDEVAVWSRALSGSEITNIYNKQQEVYAIHGNGHSFTLLNATTTKPIVSSGATINISTSTISSVNADGAAGGTINLSNTYAANISANGTAGNGGNVVMRGAPDLNLASTTISVTGTGNAGTVEFHYLNMTSHASSTLSAVSQFRLLGTAVPGQNLGNTGPFVGGAFPTLPGETAMTPTQCNFYFTGTYYLGANIAGCTVNHDGVVINAQNHTISSGSQYAITGNNRNFTLQNATTTGTIFSPGSTIIISTSTIDTVNVDSMTGGTLTLNNSRFNSISARGTAGNGGIVTLNGVPSLDIATSTVNINGTGNKGRLNVNYTNLSTNENTFFYNVKSLYVNSIFLGTWNDVFNPHSFFFNSEVANAGLSGDWNDPLNWWTDTSYNLHPGPVPSESNSVEIYSNISTSTGSLSVSAYSAVFHGTSTNSITINATTGAIFNDTSSNGVNGHIIGQAVFNDAGSNAGIITGVTTFNATSANKNTGVVINSATTTFNGNLSDSPGLVTDTNGATSTPITRIFTQTVTTTRNFLTEAGHNNWILVASGAAVNITNAIYDTATNIFKALLGGYFITGSHPSVVPQIVINSPTPSTGPGAATNYKWLPSISWDTSVSCAYSYDNFTTTNVLDCSKNGTDIPKPTMGEHTLYVQGIDVKGNETQTAGRTFVYDNTRATYTLCGDDLLDETSRPYYYLQGNVTGDCRATVNTELRGNLNNAVKGYTVSGNIIATTTGDAVSLILRNITALGDVHAEGVASGTNGASTTIVSSNVGNVLTNGAASISGKGGNSGTLNISNSTTTAVTSSAGSSAAGVFGTVGAITIAKSNILGSITASGNTDGGSASLITIATSTTYNIIANGGNGALGGGNGAIINITSSLGVASSTITVNGGNATVCGYGGDSGTVNLRRSSYGTTTANPGADLTTLVSHGGGCQDPPNGHPGTGGSTYVVSDGEGYTADTGGGDTGNSNNNNNNTNNGNNNAVAGWGGTGTTTIYGITLPVNTLKPLDLKPLPVFGGAGKNGFNFLDPISRFVFEPLPNPITTALNSSAQLNYFMAGAGLSYAQSLVGLQKNPITLGGGSLETPGIWNPKIATTTIPSILALSGTSTINQNITVKADQTIILSIKPIKIVSKVTATFNGEVITLTLNKDKTIATYTLKTPSVGGKYTLTSKSAAFPLVIEVTGGLKAAPKPLPSVPWWGKLGSWFGK